MASTCPVRASSTDRKSTRLNSSHVENSYAVFCLKKKTEARDLDVVRARGDRAVGVDRARGGDADRGPASDDGDRVRRVADLDFFRCEAPTPDLHTLSLHGALPI